jgi:hypothetical protein
MQDILNVKTAATYSYHSALKCNLLITDLFKDYVSTVAYGLRSVEWWNCEI